MIALRRAIAASLASVVLAACHAGASPSVAGGPDTPCTRACRERCIMQANSCEVECEGQASGMDEGNLEKQEAISLDHTAPCRRRCQDASLACERSCIAHCGDAGV